jgi:hypothetical protein
MCLTTITKQIAKPTLKERVVYQVLYTPRHKRDINRIRSIFHGSRYIQTGVWKKARYMGQIEGDTASNRKLYDDSGREYYSGFHGFVYAKEAKLYVEWLRQWYPEDLAHYTHTVRKVRMRRIHTIGTQDFYVAIANDVPCSARVVVASERLVP